MIFPYHYLHEEYRFSVHFLQLNLSARLHDPIFPQTHVSIEKKVDGEFRISYDTTKDGYALKAFDEWKPDFEQKIFSYYGSLYGVCNKMAEHPRTPEEVLRFFGIDHTLPLAGWKMTSPIRQANFCISDKPAEHLEYLKKSNPTWTEETLVNSRLFDALKQSLFSFELSQEYIKTYHDWYKQVFKFKNEFGETTMLVVKIYDFNYGCPKMIFPLTVWSKPQENNNRFFFIPGVGLSPLYNLDLLSRKECQTVILTDSIEIADLNQEKAPDGVVYTSFFCDSGHYEEVDWSPLKDKNLYWLIVNHSCRTMVDAYWKAASIRDYLHEKENHELKFIQLPVKYPNVWSACASQADVIQYRINNPPEVDKENVVALSENEFNSYHAKAENFIIHPPKAW